MPSQRGRTGYLRASYAVRHACPLPLPSARGPRLVPDRSLIISNLVGLANVTHEPRALAHLADRSIRPDASARVATLLPCLASLRWGVVAPSERGGARRAHPPIWPEHESSHGIVGERTGSPGRGRHGTFDRDAQPGRDRARPSRHGGSSLTNACTMCPPADARACGRPGPSARAWAPRCTCPPPGWGATRRLLQTWPGSATGGTVHARTQQRTVPGRARGPDRITCRPVAHVRHRPRRMTHPRRLTRARANKCTSGAQSRCAQYDKAHVCGTTPGKLPGLDAVVLCSDRNIPSATPSLQAEESVWGSFIVSRPED
nr:unnamed protein product [Digitaria exilis]